jgi:hypothetical protein
MMSFPSSESSTKALTALGGSSNLHLDLSELLEETVLLMVDGGTSAWKCALVNPLHACECTISHDLGTNGKFSH